MPLSTFPPSTSLPRPETVLGMVVSLMFWSSLLLASLLFALVSLSPKLLVTLQLRSQFERNQHRLVELEREGEQLQLVIDAINSDPDFSAELTRIEFDAVRPDEEIIPVDGGLKLDARAVPSRATEVTLVHEWYEPLVENMANDGKLRASFLGSATLLVILSFTMFQPAGTESLSTDVNQHHSFWQNIRRRYERHS